jgi:hypothetical protein
VRKLAFSNGYSGDSKSLNYILQTLDAKQILIPGVTSNGNLQVTVGGEVAFYYTRSAATSTNSSYTTTGTGIGTKIDYTSKGVTRNDITLNNAIQIGTVLPYVNFATVSAEVVSDKVIQESLTAANQWNELALTYIEDNATKFYKASDGSITTVSITNNAALTATTVYAEIVKMRKAFNVANKAKGMKPTAVIVSESVYALLLQSDEFIRKEQAQDLSTVAEGVIGKVAGLYVVVSPDANEDIVMLNAEGFAAPINVKSLVLADATAAGYPAGVIIAGEIGYNFEITDEDLILVREN